MTTNFNRPDVAMPTDFRPQMLAENDPKFKTVTIRFIDDTSTVFKNVIDFRPQSDIDMYVVKLEDGVRDVPLPVQGKIGWRKTSETCVLVRMTQVRFCAIKEDV